MEENRNDQRPFRNHNRHRHQHHNRMGRDNHGGGGGRGRPQRPLLTSAINAAGLTLVALTTMHREIDVALYQKLALAVACFSASALVSYIAQRMKPLIIELISDFLFLVGALLVLYMGLRLGEFISF